MSGHRLTIERSPSGLWGDCSCDYWSMGPVNPDDEDEIRVAHAIHVHRAEEDLEAARTEIDPYLYAQDPDEWEWDR